MRRHRALAKNILLGAVGSLLLAMTAGKSGAQVAFDGLDWTTDRGGIVIAASPYNTGPLRSSFNIGTNGVGTLAAPNQALDAHRAQLKWSFPFVDDLNGNTGFYIDPITGIPSKTLTVLNGSNASGVYAAEQFIVDNPYPGFNKADINVFTNSSQPLDALSQWLGPGFIIPPVAQRLGYGGFNFSFTPSDPTAMPDPYAGNPGVDAIQDYGYVRAVHNDFTVNRGTTSGPITTAEVGTFPNADPNVYSAVHKVLATELENALNNAAGSHAVALWSIGTQQNHGSDVPDPRVAGSPPPYIQLPVPYDGYTYPPYNSRPPNPNIAPNKRVVKYTVDILSPGSGTAFPDINGTLNVYPNVQRAFVRVSWKNTINLANNTVNLGTKNGSGQYVAGAGGVNDPANSRIFSVDLSQPGAIHLGAANASPASFPYGGGVDQIVVTLYSITPDNPIDPNLYNYPALVEADACQFTHQNVPGIADDPTNPPPATTLGPLNNPLNVLTVQPTPAPPAQPFVGTEFIGQAGRFLGPMIGFNKPLPGDIGPYGLLPIPPGGTARPAGSTLWYCVREEVVNNQARVATDPTLPVSATNPYTIDSSATATAPVFYCLTNERNLYRLATTTTPQIFEASKVRVRWRYVGYPDNGSATSFTSPTIANVRGRDGQYHTIIYYCSTSNTAQGNVGRIYALDALGDQTVDTVNNPDPTTPSTTTTCYWTYPSVRPLESTEVNNATKVVAVQYHDPNFANFQPDPQNLYPMDDGGKHTNPIGTPSGFWWAPDQLLFTGGSQKYFDGDLIQNNNANRSDVIVKTDTQITLGGITGSPIVINDPSNPTGAMLLVVPSTDGRMYAFDAGGRGDFSNKVLPNLPPDPKNPTLPAATLNLGYNYAIPGTTQRLWTWPHYGADAYHQIYNTNLGTPPAFGGLVKNTLLDETSKGSMPYSPSYDPTYLTTGTLTYSPLVVSAGSPSENGLPGVGHVYGLLPFHDSRVQIGQNNTPIWTVQGPGYAKATDRRYFAFPHEGTRLNDPSSTPLLDIPGVPTIFQPTNANAQTRFVYFESHGRVYSIQIPNAAPSGLAYSAGLNWVYPYTPNIPYEDPTNANTFELPQGFAPKGLSILPNSVTGATFNGNNADVCYALLTDGTILALDAAPQNNPSPTFSTNFIASGTAQGGYFTDSAPTLTFLTRGPNFGGVPPPTAAGIGPGTINAAPPASLPALVFGDDVGNIFGVDVNPQVTTINGVVTPVLLQLFGTTNNAGQIVTPPALAGSTDATGPTVAGPNGTVDPLATGLLLSTTPEYGGGFALGDTAGHMLVYAPGFYANGFGGGGGPDTNTDPGAGYVSIDVREVDAYTNFSAAKNGYPAHQWDNIAPGRGQGVNGSYTPARHEDGTAFGNTAKPATGNVPDVNGNASNGLAVDQGDNLYVAASGVYHAQPENMNLPEYGTNAPTISVQFTVTQGGATQTLPTVTVIPVTQNPNNLTRPNDAWPDDLAIPAAFKVTGFHIYGIDDNLPPTGQGNPMGQGSAAQQLEGTPHNVYPWVAKIKIPIRPNGQFSYAPLSSGYSVQARVTINQNVHVANSGGRSTINARQIATGRLGLNNYVGMSQSPYQTDPNTLLDSANQRSLFVTNPLALTVRGVPGANANSVPDLTGQNQRNIIGWAGPVENTPTDINELIGNGATVGRGALLPGQPQTNAGYIKPVFAPFGMGQDSATLTYNIDSNGSKVPGVFLMDRSNLPQVTGVPTQVSIRVNSLRWAGSLSSIMNPLPFDTFPAQVGDPVAQNGGDYPPLDARNVHVSVAGVDATHATAKLKSPTNVVDPTTQQYDPASRVPQITPVDLSAQIPRYFPANVNRGITTFPYRGKNIQIGGDYTDQSGFVRGAAQNDSRPYAIKDPILGPLSQQSGDLLAKQAGNLNGSSPSGGYVANISVSVVPTTTTPAAGTGPAVRGGRTTIGTNGTSTQVNRLFETGLAVAPSFRMRVLESTLDMGDVPHGTGYSDLVGGNFLFRYPFAPSGMAPYLTAGSGGNPPTIGYSPWDSDNQLMTPTAANIGIGVGNPNSKPQIGRFFRPFTLINDSNVNLVHPRTAKLIGPNSTDTSATPNMSGVITPASVTLNPGAGIARSLRLNSDQVNDFLAPPLLAAPFGQQAATNAVGDTGLLGNIGVVSSFDHASYAQTRLSEINLYPLFNPAMEDNGGFSPYQQAKDLFSAGLLDQDIYAQGGALQWTVNTQPRPSIHKPHSGDGTGTVATIPDQPYYLQNGTQNAYAANNPGTTVGNVYQQQQQAGLFVRPSVAVAVPLGTPVGTYSTTIYPFEDGLPIQWLEWLQTSAANSNPSRPAPVTYLGNDDDILNTSNTGQPIEPFANPGATFKLTVRESRLTEGATPGSLPQIDAPNTGTDFAGFNLQPSALLLPTTQIGNNYYNKLMLYWTTNRQYAPGNNPGQYQTNNVNHAPTATAPLNVAVSSLNLPYVYQNNVIVRPDAQFQLFGLGGTDTNGNGLPSWWGIGANRPLGLLPGFDAGGLPDQYQSLFPVQAGQGTINPASVKYGSPASTIATNYDVATGAVNTQDPESYLVMQGTADLVRTGNAAGASLAQTQTRTFIASLNNYSGSSQLGLPDFGQAGATDGFLSFLNDPNVPKLSPRPLLVKLHNVQVTGGSNDTKFLYVFWHSGAQGRTSLYYNVNVQANGLQSQFSATGFQRLGDQKLPTPGALTWQSDPYPVYRRVFDPTYPVDPVNNVYGAMVDAVEVAFTGVLKNRQTVEVLLARYRIVEQTTAATGSQAALAVGQLVPIPFPTVHQETLTRIPATNTYAARDAAWFIPNDTASQSSDSAINRYMRVFYQKNGTSGLYLLNGLTGGNGIAAANAQRGRVDPASGLVYFNATATDNTGAIVKDAGGRTVFGGGQMVVDSRSGTVSFPNIPPGKNDYILASYTPYLVRVNTSRDESNAERDPSDLGASVTSNNGNYGQLIAAHPALVSPGQNYSPTYVMDRAPNTRGLLQSPQVMFNANSSLAGVPAAFPIDRMWMLYRKSDPSGALKSTVFLKAMRLTARLPYPVALKNVGGTQQITGMTVTGVTRPLLKGYEVDYVRGRVYFQEEDEGTVVQINYTYYNPANPNAGPQNSGNLLYRVAWSDEISATGTPYDATGKYVGDNTTYEVLMPTTSVVNEGQVAAFKDPFIDKLWVFWSSTRAGTVVGNNQQVGSTDLYYETLAPQFYPSASGQY